MATIIILADRRQAKMQLLFEENRRKIDAHSADIKAHMRKALLNIRAVEEALRNIPGL